MAFRDGPLRDPKAPLNWAATGAAVLACAIAAALLLTGHRPAFAPGGYSAPRSEFDELLEPVASVLAAPIRWLGEGADYTRGYFAAAGENRRLKQQVAELQRWKDAAIALKSVNDRYEALLKLRTEPPIPSVAARVTADARGPFSNARLADAGGARGVKVGDPVISEHGAVGRIVGVARDASRILLLTDVESRTPVTVDRTNARGLLIGDGGANPRIDYVRGIDPLKPGDVLLTSGDGGGYPRGLPVGVVAKDLRGQWRARLYADRAPIDYVRILSYQDFTAGIDPKSLAGDGALPPLTTEEMKSLQAESAPAAPPAKQSAPDHARVFLLPGGGKGGDGGGAASRVSHEKARRAAETPSRRSDVQVPSDTLPPPSPTLPPSRGKGDAASHPPLRPTKPKPSATAKPKPKPAKTVAPKPAKPLADMEGLH